MKKPGCQKRKTGSPLDKGVPVFFVGGKETVTVSLLLWRRRQGSEIREKNG